MKIKEGFKLRKLCGENIVVGEGIAQINFNKMIVLNESAAYLFEEVQGKEFTQDSLTRLLLDRYSVDKTRAHEDAGMIMNKWVEAGIAE